ncbi:hypothetical protein [Roseospira goensis]|uniref:Helix-turn-helix domain-containing protein n=1 Tax=Roseospira goensis TaxID=391922 RepID=A0A7W6RW98_9PROT|nr:hypothetical protein [Roseospira goensis]MBB4284418.1 hypothetical protein [Roseospira goensis]
MTTIKDRGQFVLTGAEALAQAAGADADRVARFTGLSQPVAARVLAGQKTTWVRCAKVARALNALGAREAGPHAVVRQDG